MKNLHKYLLPVFPLIAILFVWVLWANTALTLTQYTVKKENIPTEFHGFTIAQVSDLHNTQFGVDNQKLLKMLKEAQPDLIAITGDLLDSRKTDPETVIAFATEAISIAPIYFSPGNHEFRVPEAYQQVKDAFYDLGVTILENESTLVKKDGQSILLTGLTDPDFGIPWPEFSANTYQVVLSHRPEMLEEYARREFDLVLTGHAHGGQFRLPWIGGLYAPHQGFLPEYDSDMHVKNNTTMVVSRGLGNSLFPLRFCNRPELIIITLESVEL